MKLLFIATDLCVGGGVTSSLQNITSLLVKNGHQVDILSLSQEKQAIGFEESINLIEFSKRERLSILNKEIAKEKGILAPFFLLLGLIKKALNKGEKWLNFAFRKTMYEGYDAVVAFKQSRTALYLATKKTKGARKYGFWHGDVKYLNNNSSWDSYLGDIDGLACVSDAMRDSMREAYPKIKSKIHTVYNLFKPEEILKKAEEGTTLYNEKDFNIVTVSRIDFGQKRLDWIPEIYEKIESRVNNVKWHIVGGGEHTDELKHRINKKGLNEKIILYGNQTNPYKYMKQADLFVLTSLWESYGMVVVESLICGTPVVASEYPALKEIMSEKYGISTENSIEKVADAIVRVIKDNDFYKQLKTECESYVYSNELAYSQFLKFVNS